MLNLANENNHTETQPLSSPVSIQDIAQAVGVSRSAVSLALRNKPGVLQAMRHKIMETARELGFQPNPTISRFMSQLRQSNLSPYRSTIAWLALRMSEDKLFPYWKHVFLGAKRKAEQLGYQLESYWLSERNLSPKRLSRILKARGITGIMIGSARNSYSRLNMDWDTFSAVALNYGVVRPDFPRVSNNHRQSILEALKVIKRRGYRRIGLLLVKGMEQRTNHEWESGFYLFQHLHAKRVRMILRVIDPLECNQQEYCSWVRTHRLDVVLTPHFEFLKALRAGGIRIPEDLAFVLLDREPEHQGVAGMDQQPQLIGEMAVQTLHGLIDSNSKVTTSTPSVTLINGRWMEGDTIRKPRVLSSAKEP